MDFKKKFAIEIGITLVLVAGITGGILFFSSRVRSISEEMKQERATLAERSRSLNAVAALRSEYDMRVKEKIKVLTATVPLKDQLINLSKEFQALSARSGLQTTFTFLGETGATEASFGKISYRLAIEGDFDKLLSFIGTLQNFYYLSSLDSVSLLRAKDTSTLNTKGSIYFRVP